MLARFYLCACVCTCDVRVRVSLPCWLPVRGTSWRLPSGSLRTAPTCSIETMCVLARWSVVPDRVTLAHSIVLYVKFCGSCCTVPNCVCVLQEGETALHAASGSFCSAIDTVAWLVQAGIDPDIRGTERVCFVAMCLIFIGVWVCEPVCSYCILFVWTCQWLEAMNVHGSGSFEVWLA